MMANVPYGGQNRAKLSPRTYVITIATAGAMFIVIFLYAFELPHFENTFRIDKMLKMSVLFAVLTTFFIVFRLRKQLTKTIDKIRATLLTFVGAMLLIFLSVHILNRKISIESISMERFVLVQDFSTILHTPAVDLPTNFAYIQVGNDAERIMSRDILVQNYYSTDFIEIPVARGLFGFRVAKIY